MGKIYFLLVYRFQKVLQCNIFFSHLLYLLYLAARGWISIDIELQNVLIGFSLEFVHQTTQHTNLLFSKFWSLHFAFAYDFYCATSKWKCEISGCAGAWNLWIRCGFREHSKSCHCMKELRLHISARASLLHGPLSVGKGGVGLESDTLWVY